MKDIVGLTIKLFVICVLAAGLLGATYVLTSGPIEQGQQERAKASRQTVLSEADSFEAVDVEALKVSGEWQDNEAMSVTVDEAYIGLSDGEAMGMTVKVTTKGYNPGIEMTVGFASDGSVEAVNIESHSETPGLGANATNESFLSQFAKHMPYFTVSKDGASGATEDNEEGEQRASLTPIDALTSATFTTNGVISGTNVAYDFFKSVYGKE